MAALHPSNPYYNHSLSQHYDQQSSATLEPYQPKAQRSASVDSAPPTESPKAKEPSQRPRNPVTYRTRSIGGPFCTGVYFERQIDLSPPNDEEIIIATVRVTNSFRRASVEGCDELPSRPPARNFLRRLSSRVNGSRDQDRYTAIKMPRKDYKRYFARDRNGSYAGTEPEREWSQEQLDAAFGEYQDMPLRSIPGGSEYGEGDAQRFASPVEGEGESEDGVSQMKDWSGWQEVPRPRANW